MRERLCSHVAFELKLEEVIGDLGSTLTREHKHLIPAYGYREVAARWRNLTTLVNLMNTKAETGRLTHTRHFTLLIKYENFIYWPLPNKHVLDPAD